MEHKEKRVNLKPRLKRVAVLERVNPNKIHHLLQPGEMGLVLEMTVRDKDGKVTEQRVQKGESLLRQFLELLYMNWARYFHLKNPYMVKDVAGVTRGIGSNTGVFSARAGLGIDTWGILVGSGSTSPTIDDYVVETKIAHGTGGGQLQYGNMAFGAPASDATTSQFTLTRDFANGSGGAVTVNEVVLYVKGPREDTVFYFMTIRDNIAGGVSVPDGQTLTINYRPQCVV